MQEFGLVLAITVLAVISPGGDFAMVTRNSYLHGRMAGIWTAIGIALAIWLHVAYSILGVGLLLQTSPMLLQAVKTVGALYLLYIAWQTWRYPVAIASELADSQAAFSHWSALKTGLISNALNPKTTLFVLSLYTQVIAANTALSTLLAYGWVISLAHLLWFAWVALCLSQPRIRMWLLRKQSVVNKAIACVLMLLAGLLLCT